MWSLPRGISPAPIAPGSCSATPAPGPCGWSPTTRLARSRPDTRSSPSSRGGGLAGRGPRRGRPFRTEQYRTDPRIAQALGSASEGAGSVALLVVPIKSGERIEGLLYVGNASPRPFTDRDENILLRLAGHAGVASGMRGSTPASRPP